MAIFQNKNNPEQNDNKEKSEKIQELVAAFLKTVTLILSIRGVVAVIKMHLTVVGEVTSEHLVIRFLQYLGVHNVTIILVFVFFHLILLASLFRFMDKELFDIYRVLQKKFGLTRRSALLLMVMMGVLISATTVLDLVHSLTGEHSTRMVETTIIKETEHVNALVER